MNSPVILNYTKAAGYANSIPESSKRWSYVGAISESDGEVAVYFDPGTRNLSPAYLLFVEGHVGAYVWLAPCSWVGFSREDDAARSYAPIAYDQALALAKAHYLLTHKTV